MREAIMRVGPFLRLVFAVAAAGLFAMVQLGCGGGKKGADSNASLSSLVLSAGTIAPAFSKETISYSAEVAFAESPVTVTPTAEAGKATIAVNGESVQSGTASQSISLTVGSNAIAVVVTAEDGATTRTYTVSVTQQACVPSSCSGRDCGSDGCGGTCGGACVATGEQCNSTGQCVRAGTGTWVGIGAGRFTMGSPDAELGRDTDEVQHQVTLTHGFVMLSTEVTQGQFMSLMTSSYTSNPSSFNLSCGSSGTTNCPVETVSWHEAAAYCNALSMAAGRGNCYTCTRSGTDVSCSLSTGSPYDCTGYRLPTEAEWEYAARAGTTTATYAGELTAMDCNDTTLGPIAWFCGNAISTTHAVGTKNKNAWGLYDMLGNVFEWCHDWYDDYPAVPATDPWGPKDHSTTLGSIRVFRGGSWDIDAWHARAAFRNFKDPAARYDYLGFRPVRSLP